MPAILAALSLICAAWGIPLPGLPDADAEPLVQIRRSCDGVITIWSGLDVTSTGQLTREYNPNC